MAIKKLQSERDKAEGSFQVTCVIGTVSFGFGATGPSPDEEAFRLIANHEAEGLYTFPHEDGRTIEVEVNYRNENEKENASEPV